MLTPDLEPGSRKACTEFNFIKAKVNTNILASVLRPNPRSSDLKKVAHLPRMPLSSRHCSCAHCSGSLDGTAINMI